MNREAIAATIETLIDLLDLLDGDPDLVQVDERERDSDFGHCLHYGIDQSRPIGADNVAVF